MGSDISMMQYGPGHPAWKDDQESAEHHRRAIGVAHLAAAVVNHLGELAPGALMGATRLRPALANLRAALTDLRAYEIQTGYGVSGGGTLVPLDVGPTRRQEETEKHPYFPSAYTIVHVDTFDQGRDVRHMTETQAEAESWVRRTYGDRIKQDGADRVLVVHRGRVITSFNVG